MSYVLNLSKIEKDRGTIEVEIYKFDNKARKTLISGGLGNVKIGVPQEHITYSRGGKKEFSLKIIPEKIIL